MVYSIPLDTETVGLAVAVIVPSLLLAFYLGKRHDKISTLRSDVDRLMDKVDVISSKLERLIIADEISRRERDKK